MSRITIPIGPQHPALKEPISFLLTAQGERIVDSTLRIGYAHRGLERIFQNRNYVQNVRVVERVCGICSHVHTTAYCQGVEALLELEVPPRALYIRTLMCELERIHSHLLWLGVLAEHIGFTTIFMYAWRDREIVMDIMEELSGGRVAHGVKAIGGVRVDIDPEHGKSILARLDELERQIEVFLGVVLHERTFQVRTQTGEMVRLDSVVEITHGVGPINVNRTDRERSLLLTANLEGVVLNRALETVDRILAEELPEGYHAKATGTAEEYAESMNSLLFALGLAILIVYMLLASQFDSLLHPFTIMFALPPAMTGALLALFITGYTINIMSVIGVILLFGLVTKNSILLVDLTIQKQETGLDREEALRIACPIRLRPILMTAVSMIFGVLPVALAIGEGAEARAPMAVATGCGMISSTALTLLVVPVFYLVLDDFVEGAKRRLRRLLRRSGAPAEAPSVSR